MRTILSVCLFALLASIASAQTATVAYDVPASVTDQFGKVSTFTPAQVTAWTATFYVNAGSVPLADKCVQATAALITCTAPLPNITTLLSPAGTQYFEVALKDAILEGPHSLPLELARPPAPSAPRIQ